MKAALSIALLLCTTACAGQARTSRLEPRLSLHPCHLDDLAEEVACGSLLVAEDRSRADGRRLAVHVAVLRALRRSVAADPLFIMAGGPGQGARSYAALIARAFRAVRRTRDIVLVDLRGTGASHPLNCPSPADEILALTQWVADPADRTGDGQRQVAACVAALAVDLRHYTHAAALADLDEIRRTLGYERINLWGGSWGTRAALLYALTYPAAVRAVVLDGAVPLDMEFPASVAADAERAVERLAAACAAERACAQAFADPRGAIAALLREFDAGPVIVSLRHPRSNVPIAVPLTRPIVAEIVRASLYSPLAASRLPALIQRAREREFAPLVTQWMAIASATTETMALGATLAILCSEDVPLDSALSRLGHGKSGETSSAPAPIFASGYADFWIGRCRHWPKGPPIAVGRRTAEAPALILSGELDPVTPPRWGDAMARAFPRHTHVVVAGAAHNTSFSGCVPDLIARFLDTAAPDAVDPACVHRIRRVPFATSAAGAQP